MTELYLNVAVPTPLRRVFSYRCKDQTRLPAPGCRVLVPFGRRKLVGIVVGTTNQSGAEQKKTKFIQEVIDDTPLWPQELWELLNWSALYYQHPLGDVLHTALPAPLRIGKQASAQTVTWWQLSETGKAEDLSILRRAPKQLAIVQLLQQHPHGLSEEAMLAQHPGQRDALKRLGEKGLLIRQQISDEPFPSNPAAQPGPVLNDEQQHAVHHIVAALGTWQAFLLEGVTGSGKTEVYLNCMSACISRGQQALVLVPEIGLTPQMIQRFARRLPYRVAVLHSGLTDRERQQTWLAARAGKVDVILGTRSAIFTPLKSPGLLIIDEEHDASFKQQDGFRYSARDLAIWRARHNNIPIVLGSATPSTESLFNVQREKFQLLPLSQRAGNAKPPRLHLLDMRSQPIEEGLSGKLIQLMQQHLQNNNQVLLFLNRRGFAPTLMCHDCGWIARCQRCDAHMTYHHSDRRLRCHHCGAERRAETSCLDCESKNLLTLGAGTERIEQALKERFADTEIIRIDRDTTRRKGSLDDLLARVKNGQRQILIGTQMLAKGHHFPNVTLVGIIDADQGLHSAEFRAPERMAQLILQVAGRAGRAEQPGEVYIQTHHPDHPLLLSLIRDGYNQFASQLLRERAEVGLPPITAMALFRAEAVNRDAPLGYLQQIRDIFKQRVGAHLQVFGPMPAPMEKRAGRFRAQLVIQAKEKAQLHQALATVLPAIEAMKNNKVRWSLDVDPIDTY